MGNNTSRELEASVLSGNLAMAGIILAENPSLVVTQETVTSAISQCKLSRIHYLFARELIRKIRTGVLKVSTVTRTTDLRDSDD